VAQGVKSKLASYDQILREAALEDTAVAYMGDDLLDLPVISRVGLSGAPADAAPEVRARVDWVSQAGGGRGAVREFIELVLRAQDRWERVTRDYFMKA
jgi:3-deoxy-D-manno-octulosonate 8-phosphate phosphatase (KDO 8-P phosphatase)